jgi:hypothetical protein
VKVASNLTDFPFLYLKQFKFWPESLILFTVKGSSYCCSVSLATLSFHGSPLYTSRVLPSSLTTSSSIHLHVSYFIHFLLPLSFNSLSSRGKSKDFRTEVKILTFAQNVKIWWSATPHNFAESTERLSAVLLLLSARTSWLRVYYEHTRDLLSRAQLQAASTVMMTSPST